MSKVIITKDQIIEAIADMNIMEVVELSKMLEKKFEVSYASFAAGSGSAAPAAVEDESEEQAKPKEAEECKVVLEKLNEGFERAKLLLAMKQALSLTLAEAISKTKPENLPTTLKEGLSKKESEELKEKLSNFGADITIQ